MGITWNNYHVTRLDRKGEYIEHHKEVFSPQVPLSEVFLDPGTRMGIGFQRILLLNSTRVLGQKIKPTSF
jgi:hypothetical protein